VPPVTLEERDKSASPSRGASGLAAGKKTRKRGREPREKQGPESGQVVRVLPDVEAYGGVVAGKGRGKRAERRMKTGAAVSGEGV